MKKTISNIIVEGADCSGKDSLIKELERITGFSVVRGSSFEISKNGSQAMHDIMKDNIEKGKTIFNRSHYSNLVYADLYGYPKIEEALADSLQQKIDDENVLVIYLYSSPTILAYRMVTRGDDDVKPDELVKILNGYNRLFNFEYSPKTMLCYDTNNTNIHEISEDISHFYNFKPSE